MDALVNVAGVVQHAPCLAVTEKQMRLVFEVNCFAPIRFARLFLPLMLRSDRGGAVVNVSSVGGRMAWPWTGLYSASKAALNLFSDSLRIEARACGLPLRCAVVAPGPVDTPMANNLTGGLRKFIENNQEHPFTPGITATAERYEALIKHGMQGAEEFPNDLSQIEGDSQLEEEYDVEQDLKKQVGSLSRDELVNLYFKLEEEFLAGKERFNLKETAPIIKEANALLDKKDDPQSMQALLDGPLTKRIKTLERRRVVLQGIGVVQRALSEEIQRELAKVESKDPDAAVKLCDVMLDGLKELQQEMKGTNDVQVEYKTHFLQRKKQETVEEDGAPQDVDKYLERERMIREGLTLAEAEELGIPVTFDRALGKYIPVVEDNEATEWRD